MTDIGILGADGRMGRAVIRALLARANEGTKIQLSAALTAPSSPNLGKDAGTLAGTAELGVRLSSDMKAGLDSCDVVIDFSRPQAAIDCVLAMNIRRCRAFVTGTTGYTDIEAKALIEAGREVVLLQSGNFSLGVNLLEALVEQAARALGSDWDIEIAEQHHKHKVCMMCIL